MGTSNLKLVLNVKGMKYDYLRVNYEEYECK